MELNRFMSTLAPPPPQEPEKPLPAAVESAELPDDAIPEGQRNTTMSHIAGRLIKRYGNSDEARKLFVEKAKTCDPPLSRDELTAIWKSAVKFGKKVAAQEKFIIKGGFVDGKVISVPEVKALADLPSREILIATVLGTMIAPVRGLATVLDANISGLARVINAIAEQKGA